jgi:hypothetical protein
MGVNCQLPFITPVTATNIVIPEEGQAGAKTRAVDSNHLSQNCYSKGKVIPLQARCGPEGG